MVTSVDYFVGEQAPPIPVQLHGVLGMRAGMAAISDDGQDLAPVYALAKALDGSGGGGHEAALLYQDFGEPDENWFMRVSELQLSFSWKG